MHRLRMLAPALLFALVPTTGAILSAGAAQPAPAAVTDPAAYVNPLIGSANGGNTFPGAVLPFGMVAWSPESRRPDPQRGEGAMRTAAAGGYQRDTTRIRGFSLTHLSGTGCRGASGDVPFLPYTGSVTTSPSADASDATYASDFDHANERAEAGVYQVRLASGVNVELTATARTGSGRFTFPSDDAGGPETVLIRTSDSEVGSSDAGTTVDATSRTVSGWVSSGNFCGYLNEIDRRSYYTLYFVAVFDRPFASVGTWQDAAVSPAGTTAYGGTTYADRGYPAAGKGSGAWVSFDHAGGTIVTVRVGISYVSLANARANLAAENPAGTPFGAVRTRAHDAWNAALGRIQVSGGTDDQRTIFYTALYHALLHLNLTSDVNGEYRGFDNAVHHVGGTQRAQYANFSGWDVYRSQLQLVALLDPGTAADMAQSLVNQAAQNGGHWDRWTHNSGATHVMEGDPSPPAVASIYAFGGTGFDAKGAVASLVKAATEPTAHDLSNEGCSVECAGQRPSLDKWLTLHYIPARSNAWGGAGETLEDVTADFSLAQLAGRLGDQKTHADFMARAQYWKNLFNPKPTLAASRGRGRGRGGRSGRGGRGGRTGRSGAAGAGRRGGQPESAPPPSATTLGPVQGYIQNRNEDGTWPSLDPSSSSGFAEGSSAQYTWMIPFNVRGLFDAMGGNDAAIRRLDQFFHATDGSWAFTRAGGLHAEMNNEPSTGTPWLYLFAGRADKTQQTVRQVVTTLWKNAPDGIPGNDDLGAMSAWFVWAAMGLYPETPGRAELLVASPLFPHIVIRRANGKTITIDAPAAAADAPYVRRLRVNGQASERAWLPESFVTDGGTLDFTLSATADPGWASRSEDAPPSFGASGSS